MLLRKFICRTYICIFAYNVYCMFIKLEIEVVLLSFPYIQIFVYFYEWNIFSQSVWMMEILFRNKLSLRFFNFQTIKSFQRILLSVVMNMNQPWTIKPWHIKTSFRKCGYIVPEYALTLPEHPITGPDMNLENKEFFVTLTVRMQQYYILFSHINIFRLIRLKKYRFDVEYIIGVHTSLIEFLMLINFGMKMWLQFYQNKLQS